MHFEDFLKSGRYLKSWSPKTVRSYQQAWNSFLRFQESQREAGFEPARPSGSGGRQSTTSDCCNTVLPLTKAHLEAWVMWMRQTMNPGGCNCYITATSGVSERQC